MSPLQSDPANHPATALAIQFQAIYGRPPEAQAFAPGRIEFIGNHTDYNGGAVIGAAIDRGVWVALAPRSDGRRRLSSLGQEGCLPVELAVGVLEKQTGCAAWSNYPVGVLATLPHFGFRVPAGFDFLAVSNLPVGAGLSSSAALELAAALGFLELTNQQCPHDILVQIGRKAENDFVGIPCGILDQGVSAFGSANSLVHIDCLRMRFSLVPLPPEVNFWLFNTHQRHALVDGLYAARHRECMQAASVFGVSLAEVTLGQLEARQGFLPGKSAERARHVIEEIERVRETVAALKAGMIGRVGGLLTASHRSSQRLFENSTLELDFLVDALISCRAVYGARLTGGGFGGAVMAMTRGEYSYQDANQVARCYNEQFGRRIDILCLRASDGARVLSC